MGMPVIRFSIINTFTKKDWVGNKNFPATVWKRFGCPKNYLKFGFSFRKKLSKFWNRRVQFLFGQLKGRTVSSAEFSVIWREHFKQGP